MEDEIITWKEDLNEISWEISDLIVSITSLTADSISLLISTIGNMFTIICLRNTSRLKYIALLPYF